MEKTIARKTSEKIKKARKTAEKEENQTNKKTKHKKNPEKNPQKTLSLLDLRSHRLDVLGHQLAAARVAALVRVKLWRSGEHGGTGAGAVLWIGKKNRKTMILL